MLTSHRVALGTFAVLAVLLIGGALPAFASAAAAPAASGTTVRVPQHLCAAPFPGQMSCDAISVQTERVSPAEARKLRAAGIALPVVSRSAGAGPNGGYTPGQLATAYSVNAAAATTQTVAIVDAYRDPSVTADLDHFDANYGLPAETSTSLKVVSQTGGSVSAVKTDAGWAGEITLDVDAVRGLCHACKILLVEANSSSGDDLATAVNYAAAHASIVSNSYGGTEEPNDSDASSYNHSGVAILASTGDEGWYSWDYFNESLIPPQAPQVPASYNTVVGVGGTTLNLNSDNSRASETVWNDNGPDDDLGLNFANLGASGGGCSSIYSAQPWQQDVAGYSSLGCGATLRNGVDVAADADYVTGYDTYETTTSWCIGDDDNGNPCPGDLDWQTYGGTSLASPLVAAMWALAGGPASVKYPALTLYGHFKTSSSQLYDVTSGGNGYCGGASVSCNSGTNVNHSNGGLSLDCRWALTGNTVLTNKGQCNAQAGYDGVSGVGTPKSAAVFQPLSPTATIGSPGTVTVGVSHAFSASGSVAPFPGDSITQYKWSWGDGATSTTSSASASHTYASTGAKTVTLTVTDGDSSINNGRTGSKSIQVAVKSAAPACIVPKVTGKTLKAAKSALTKAHCKAGKVSQKFSKVKKGHVISEKPAAGKQEPAGTKVGLVVSKGKKKA